MHGKKFSKGNVINLEKIFATHIKAKVDFPNTQSTPQKSMNRKGQQMDKVKQIEKWAKDMKGWFISPMAEIQWL